MNKFLALMHFLFAGVVFAFGVATVFGHHMTHVPVLVYSACFYVFFHAALDDWFRGD